MKVLLDTNVFLWAQTTPERLGEYRALVDNSSTERLVSAVVAWEIAIKNGMGRLPLPGPLTEFVPERIRRLAARPVAIEHAHALEVATLPPLHRDPFDRLLIAQSRLLDAPLLTGDAFLQRYDAEVLLVG